jgi:hypothetical protein
MAVAMGEAMLVERPAEPVVKDSRKTIGVLALAIIKGGPRFGYGTNQRWNNNNNAGRGGYQNRATSHGGVTRGGIDADLLQQTVQAVVAAVTTAQKTPEVAQHATPPAESGDVIREAVVPVAAPTVGQQQRVVA